MSDRPTGRPERTPPPEPTAQGFPVELPAGGRLQLQTIEEVEQWETAAKRYQEDYNLTKTNDLVLLGAILGQQLALYRAQVRLAGMEPEFDSKGVPTGRYRRMDVKESDAASARNTIENAAKEIRALEKALGVDKLGREAGGSHTVGSYIATLKKKAHEYGVHLSQRVVEYERVIMEARWKLRLLENGDAEDLREHDLSPEKFISWMREEVARLEEVDKRFADEKGKMFVGKI